MKIIITHQNADFDGLASMLAARKLWPDHQLVMSSAVSPPVKKYLALHRDWLGLVPKAELDDHKVREVVVVDSRDRRRFSDFDQALEAAESITIFDHHPRGEYDMEASEAIIEPVGACTTLLCERLESDEVDIDSEEATLMMLGIYADTGNLSFPSTTARDLRAAAFLRCSGASLPVVNRYLQQEYSPPQQQLLVALMHGMTIHDRQGLELGLTHYESPSYIKGASQVVERVLQLMGLDACFAVLEVEGRQAVQLIGRSRSRLVNAAEVASRWGGGGHASAAAARSTDISASAMLEALGEYLETLTIEALSVRDVMSSPVQVVPHDMKLSVLQPQLKKWGVSGVPVMRDKALVGVVSRRDCDEAARREDWTVPVAGFMSHEVVTIGPDSTIDEALERMTDEDIGRLPVLDDGALVGIITRSDVLARLYVGEHSGGC